MAEQAAWKNPASPPGDDAAGQHLTGQTVAVAGGGSIGVAFAVTFAKAGATVHIYEPAAGRQEVIAGEVVARLDALADHGLLEEKPQVVADRVSVFEQLATAVAGAVLVQECVPEQVAIKHELFAELAELTGPECIVASSSSFLTTSTSACGTGVADRALVAHPGNPPYAIPVVELVPNPETQTRIVEQAQVLYTAAGMSPVVVEKEIEGFVFNRLQGAMLREAYALVRDGVTSVEGVDTIVREGLGRRWCFMGPFETVDLNTRGGIESHAQKMGPSYHRMGLERGDTSEWTPDLVAKVASQRREELPLDHWDDRVDWRDEQLLNRLSADTSD